MSESLGNLLGKSYGSGEVKRFVATLGEGEVFEDDSAPDKRHYCFEQGGCEIIVDVDTNRVIAIFLYAPLSRDGYRGALPHGLDFSMPRAHVHKVMGAPDHAESFYDAWKEDSCSFRVEYRKNAIKKLVFTFA